MTTPVNRLKPPKRHRRVTARVCMNCREFRNRGDGTCCCVRPDGPEWDTGDGWYWHETCDRWQAAEWAGG